MQDTVCTIQNITIVEEGGDGGDGGVFGFGQPESEPQSKLKSKSSFPSCVTYKVIITGDRFLYKMVRFLVGTIVLYGTDDNRQLQELSDALTLGEWKVNHQKNNNSNKTVATNTRLCAPANGLVLDNIDYGDKWKFNWIINSKSIES